MAADWESDFPLAHRDRNWELLRYNWDEETGTATFAYRHRFTDAMVEDKRHQPKYVPAKSAPAAHQTKWIPRGGRNG